MRLQGAALMALSGWLEFIGLALVERQALEDAPGRPETQTALGLGAGLRLGTKVGGLGLHLQGSVVVDITQLELTPTASFQSDEAVGLGHREQLSAVAVLPLGDTLGLSLQGGWEWSRTEFDRTRTYKESEDDTCWFGPCTEHSEWTQRRSGPLVMVGLRITP